MAAPHMPSSMKIDSVSVRLHTRSVLLSWALLASTVSPAWAQETEDWGIKFQSTYVAQSKRAFAAAYSGPNSLIPQKEFSYSFTATAALGFRPWSGTEIYLNPELSQGVPLSGLTGLGGFPNGELARTSGPSLNLYRARTFIRQTWGVAGESEKVESDFNQLAGSARKQRLVLTLGTISIQDIFDDNAYSHDPRTQFLNWALITHGAYDFAADARGYTTGAALEYFHDDWAVRFGRFAQPKEPNQQALDERLLKNYGDQLELERAHTLLEQPGKLRLLAFRNVAKMSRYADALSLATRTRSTPELNAVRTGQRVKYGVGVNIEQAITADIGVFARAMWADGNTETYAYTEVDRSLSLGTLVKGTAWGRARDTFGFALAVDGLSAPHRRYLERGGLGFFIGDGTLNYRPETLIEAFYSVNVFKGAWLSADAQYIRNPAYNADRGPVKIGTFRLHAEF